MPVKQHAEAPPLSAAWHWTLMVGTLPTARLFGWVEQAQDMTDYTVAGDRLWLQHRAALITEAAAHQFEPYWKTQRAPAGVGFRKWRDAFLASNTY